MSNSKIKIASRPSASEIPNALTMSLRSYRNRVKEVNQLSRLELKKSSSSESDSTPHDLNETSGLRATRKSPRLKELRQTKLVSSESATDEDSENNNCPERVGVSRSVVSSAKSTSENSSCTDDEDAIGLVKIKTEPVSQDEDEETENPVAVKYARIALECVVFHAFPHFQQQYNWDCGVSCVAMLLDSEKRQKLFADLDYFRFNETTGFNSSTWTIDLCYLLAHVGVPHRMFTVSLGVDPNLGKESFYGSIIKVDAVRVRQRFEDRHLHGIEVQECQLTMHEVHRLIVHFGPVIVLVNANLLTCSDCSWKFIQVCTKMCCLKYQGHFILVLGLNMVRNKIHYRNPGNPDEICSMSFEEFEVARSSFGTDYDLIAIRDMSKVVEYDPKKYTINGVYIP